MFHGHGKREAFFEGWYFKCVDASQQHVYAFIPGVFMASGGREKSHSFVQVLDGATGRSTYHQYALDDFSASTREFDVHVGPNHFRLDALSLELASQRQTVRGRLQFEGQAPWPVSPASPGVMGPYAFAPFMECYHGVLSLDHAIHGALEINGAPISFDAGRGYIEKDWGQAFPQAWIWLQTNHFDQQGVSVTASVATVPWLGSHFRGFTIGLLHQARLYRFATYTGARITSLQLTDTQARLRVADRHYALEIDAQRSEGGLLHAPYRVEMLQRVTESLTASVAVRLLALERGRERVIFEGTGRHAGLEISGELQQIFDA
ncbi:MAG TPA: tocopherol cyclase family protein [Anaerolineae bacterium]